MLGFGSCDPSPSVPGPLLGSGGVVCTCSAGSCTSADGSIGKGEISDVSARGGGFITAAFVFSVGGTVEGKLSSIFSNFLSTSLDFTGVGVLPSMTDVLLDPPRLFTGSNLESLTCLDVKFFCVALRVFLNGSGWLELIIIQTEKETKAKCLINLIISNNIYSTNNKIHHK